MSCEEEDGVRKEARQEDEILWFKAPNSSSSMERAGDGGAGKVSKHQILKNFPCCTLCPILKVGFGRIFDEFGKEMAHRHCTF
jgi:hypothetical protein